MATATDYLNTYRHLTCAFYDLDMVKGESRLCGEPAVAVYITDDHHHIGRYICAQHAREAERAGDGPVFWPRERD